MLSHVFCIGFFIIIIIIVVGKASTMAKKITSLQTTNTGTEWKAFWLMQTITDKLEQLILQLLNA